MFSVMWVISPVKKRIFCPKTTKFSPKLAFLSIAGSFGALLVGWLVVVARAVSRKTPIYFIYKPWRKQNVVCNAQNNRFYDSIVKGSKTQA